MNPIASQSRDPYWCMYLLWSPANSVVPRKGLFIPGTLDLCLPSAAPGYHCQPECTLVAEEQPEHMQVDTTRTLLSPGKKEQWQTQDWCLYCMGVGRWVNHCLVKHREPASTSAFSSMPPQKLGGSILQPSPLQFPLQLSHPAMKDCVKWAMVDSGASINFMDADCKSLSNPSSVPGSTATRAGEKGYI